MSNLDFYREVMALLAEPTYFSKQLYTDMYHIKEYMLREYSPDKIYLEICNCCGRVARNMGGRLPDAVHNRLVLGPQNKWTQKYIKLCEKKAVRPLLEETK